MPITLNISLAEVQKGWLNSRRKAGGFSSQSDVVRDLIRSEQEREGSDEAEPAAVLVMVKKVKKARRAG